ncbi:hypothetical protein GCM10007857_64990 [Bradyrhizobium iriomotense]|uniref:DUF3800 domain-containing protein n=2 Tax=Bradyrhizobium iriomotense TaxID=441950 RepID=A0ABQ6BA24_9BRAD|nr:hypothetical protein GCM10007857_64990 [Bradyrhizobium iriomotense]
MGEIAPMELKLPNDCLAVFADDTGHEALVPDQPVYGLGGCAVLAQDLDAIVRTPWRQVRRQATGSPDTPLHASDFGRSATREQILAAAAFFRQGRFARFGAIVSVDTAFDGNLGPLLTIALVLRQRIIDIARWTRFGSVAVIFESSERADPLIEKAFQDFSIEENGKPLPVECYFMRKQEGEPGLEVADFIMHAIGRQARHNLTKRGTFVPDFAAVFHGIDTKLVSFMEVSSVVQNRPAIGEA